MRAQLLSLRAVTGRLKRQFGWDNASIAATCNGLPDDAERQRHLNVIYDEEVYFAERGVGRDDS